MTPKHAFRYVPLLLIILLAACKKDDDAPPDKSANKVTATIQVASEAPFTFTVTGEAADIKPVAPGSTTYHITATDGANRKLFIFLLQVTAPGTIPLTATTSFEAGKGGLEYTHDVAATGPGTIYSTYPASVTSKGSVTVTVLNPRRIEGTFSARAKNTDDEEVVITNGSFSGAL